MKKNVSLVLKSVNLKTLILYKNFLIKLFDKLNIKKKFLFLPKKKKIITLIKSPHVKKKKKNLLFLLLII
jgi:ribosomal protein S10